MITEIAALDGTGLVGNIIQENIHLWILPGCDSGQLIPLLSMPWVAIWNADPAIDLVVLLERIPGSRATILVDQPDKDPANHRASEFVKVYQLVPRDPLSITQGFLAQQLKSKVAAVSGLLAFLGPATASWGDIRLARELAPHLLVMTFDRACLSLKPDPAGTIFCWGASVAEFIAQSLRLREGVGDPTVLKLKDAEQVRVDHGLLEDLSSSWTVLTRSIVLDAKVNQDGFDQFLNGTEVWAQYVAGAPYRRKEACQSLLEKKWPGDQVDFVDAVLGQLAKLELETNEPTQGLRMIRLFVESGSGATTLLRQTAIETARHGYPTLVTKPFPRDLVESSLEKFIVHVQKQWLEARRGVGSGSGLIPVCLILDTDAEQIFEQRKFARILAGLNQRIVVVRALERSHDELEAARGVFALPASTPTTKEILALGGHLRRFCARHRLAPMPADEEWRAYHTGLQRILRRNVNALKPAAYYVETLFLVGIHPFIKERVTDENSLEQYYYRKWKDLGSENIQTLIALLAAVGVYGISLPYDILRRHPRLDLTEVFNPKSEIHRRLDVFIRWRNDDFNAQDISLYIRHPAIGRLLSRILWPLEGDFPFTSVVELLKELGTGESDMWVANAIAYYLGRQFKARAPRFSLETDSSSQRAAREIFNAIPLALKEQSRTIRHHEGRYHLHVIRACQRALENPKTTTLTADEVEQIASAEWRIADDELQRALAVQDQGESSSNIFNTMATNAFTYSRIVEARNPAEYRTMFEQALDFQENAIKGDPANDYALFQFVRQIQKVVPSHSAWSDDEKLDLYVRAEARLIELVRLHSEMRWRHTDAVEAEISLDELVKGHAKLVSSIKVGNGSQILDRFRVRNHQAAVILQIRQTLGETSLEAAFRREGQCDKIRLLREELKVLPNKTPMSLSYLYRLFLADPEGRLEFETRLNILHDLKRRDLVQFDPYRHDEAALYCQLDKLDIGEERFRELRQFRQAHGTQWLWLNEKILLKKNGEPRELVLEVTDPKGGYARIRDTSIKLKYQPYQFPTLVKNQVFKAYVRFTMSGFQAISWDLAMQDVTDLGAV